MKTRAHGPLSLLLLWGFLLSMSPAMSQSTAPSGSSPRWRAPDMPPPPAVRTIGSPSLHRWTEDSLDLPDAVYSHSNAFVSVVGFSERLGAVILRSEDSTEGIGGNPAIRYLAVDITSGTLSRDVEASFNIETRVTGSGDWQAEYRRLQQEVDRMTREAEGHVSSWQPRPLSDPPRSLSLLVGSFQEGSEEELGYSVQEMVFFLWDGATGWARPFGKATVPAFGPESLTAGKVLIDETSGALCAFFRTPMLMEFAPGDDLVFVVPPDFVARFYNEVGYEHYRARRYGAAEYFFRSAASFAPDYDKALYNAACMLAIQGKVDGALHYLEALTRLNTPESRARLGKVSSDSDYNPVRTDTRFASGLEALRNQAGL